jgi:hypothetical protein
MSAAQQYYPFVISVKPLIQTRRHPINGLHPQRPGPRRQALPTRLSLDPRSFRLPRLFSPALKNLISKGFLRLAKNRRHRLPPAQRLPKNNRPQNQPVQAPKRPLHLPLKNLINLPEKETNLRNVRLRRFNVDLHHRHNRPE